MTGDEAPASSQGYAQLSFPRGKANQFVFKKLFASWCGLLSMIGLTFALYYLGILYYHSATRPSIDELNMTDGDGVPAGALGDGIGDLFTWIHVSDVHIHRERPDILVDFKHWTTNIVRDTIQPEFVICSGDLVHSYNAVPDPLEFGDYRNALTVAGLDDPNFWYDIGGNHDMPAVRTYDSAENEFKNYAVQGQAFIDQDPSGMLLVADVNVTTALGSDVPIRIAAMNQIGEYSLDGRFNNFPHAVFDPELWERVGTASAEAEDDAMKILVGHYPRATWGPGANANAKKMSDGTVGPAWDLYLSGHLHLEHYAVYGGDGILELELADFKNKRAWRLYSYDGGMTSLETFYHDEELGRSFPLAMVTNPPCARTYTYREPLGRIAASTHFRVLVFGGDKDLAEPLEVQVSGEPGFQCTLELSSEATAALPLYTCPWTPAELGSGLHVAQVLDGDGNVLVKEHVFSVDGTAAPLDVSFSTQVLAVTPLGPMMVLAVLGLWTVTFGSLYVSEYAWYQKHKDGTAARWKEAMERSLMSDDDGSRSWPWDLRSLWNRWVYLNTQGTPVGRTALALIGAWILVGPHMFGPLTNRQGTEFGFSWLWGEKIVGLPTRFTFDMTAQAFNSLMGITLPLWGFVLTTSYSQIHYRRFRAVPPERRQPWWRADAGSIHPWVLGPRGLILGFVTFVASFGILRQLMSHGGGRLRRFLTNTISSWIPVLGMVLVLVILFQEVRAWRKTLSTGDASSALVKEKKSDDGTGTFEQD